jgi:hypothetical protein
MFLDYGPKDNPTDKEEEEYIKSKIDKFFSEENFHQPAIAENGAFDETTRKRKFVTT